MEDASVVWLVARRIIDHNHPSSKRSVGISEGYFIFDVASLPLEVAQHI